MQMEGYMKNKAKRSFSIWLLAAFLFILGTYSCSEAHPSSITPTGMVKMTRVAGTLVSTITSTPTADGKVAPPPEATTPTRTILPSATLQPTTQSSSMATIATVHTYYASLPPGQYLAYHNRETDQEGGLQAISPNGAILTQLTNFDAYPVTADGKNVLVLSGDPAEQPFEFILNLENNETIQLPTISDCAYFSGLPDLSKLAMWCGDHEIYVFTRKDQSLVPVTNITKEEEYYFFPLWSPDGKWIAFFNLTYGSNTRHGQNDPDDGLYLVDTACLADPDTCPAKTRGPFQDDLYLQGPYAWSPDSQELVIPSNSLTGPIKIFDLKTERFHNLKQIGGYGLPRSMAWSPDGEWIAYSQMESENDSSYDIFLTPAKGGEPIQLVNSSSHTAIAYFWFTVPLPFHVEDTFAITEAGANLNLRQSPDLSAKVLKILQAGEQVQVLEGPVDAEGYRWWRARVISDGEEGWLVEFPVWFTLVDSQK
jgi:WD40 repeat protein